MLKILQRRRCRRPFLTDYDRPSVYMKSRSTCNSAIMLVLLSKLPTLMLMWRAESFVEETKRSNDQPGNNQLTTTAH
jgi:hypothetical protein